MRTTFTTATKIGDLVEVEMIEGRRIDGSIREAA